MPRSGAGNALPGLRSCRLKRSEPDLHGDDALAASPLPCLKRLSCLP